MGFDYDPKDASNTIPVGEYEAVIAEVRENDKNGVRLVSKKNGEAMQAVRFTVYTETAERQITQHFTAKSTLFMYRSLASAIGQAEAFKNKTFDAADHIGTRLRLGLTIKNSAQYGDQNQIDAFLPAEGAAPVSRGSRPSAGGAAVITEEDIPFSPMDSVDRP